MSNSNYTIYDLALLAASLPNEVVTIMERQHEFGTLSHIERRLKAARMLLEEAVHWMPS